MAYNYAHEDYLERKHNNRVEAMYFAAKTKGKSNSFFVDGNLTESFNPFTEVISEVKSSEDNEATDKLFGWGKYANIETFLK